MKHEAPDSDKEVPKVRDAEYSIMAVVPAGMDAEVSEVDEQQVREGVDYLGGVVGQIVVFFAPLNGRCYWFPEARLVGGRIGNRGEP